MKKIFAGDGAENDEFGISSSISGDIVVVGARFDDDVPNSSGSAYIFERNHGGTDNWGQSKKLIASDYRVSDQFGISVAISGDTVVVGALNGDGNGINTGSAYIFERDHPSPGAWGQRKEIFASDGMLSERFGISVAISGDKVIVGADLASENGAVYIFGRDEGGPNNWGQMQKITACDAMSFDSFGHSVSISGNTLVAGTPDNDDNGSSSGSAYIFIEGAPPSCHKAMPWIPLLLFDN